MNKTWIGHPLTIDVLGKELVILVGIDTLAFAFEESNGNQLFDERVNDYRREWKVVDKHKFAKGVANALCEEAEDGSTVVTRMLENACIVAVENDVGVEEDGSLMTAETRK